MRLSWELMKVVRIFTFSSIAAIWKEGVSWYPRKYFVARRKAKLKISSREM